MVLTLQLSILCKGHQRLMLVGDLLIQDCIQAFLQHTANGRSLKAQCHHIMSINCQVLECEAALFLQDLIDHLRYFLKDCDPVSADGRLTKRICLVQLDQLPGSILTVLAQKPFDWLPVGRDGHVMIANESYNLFFAGAIEAKSTEDILLVAKTGMRFSEALALTPKDFDFAHQTLSISKTWDYKGKGGFQPTKNKSSVRKIQIDWQTVIQFSELVKHLPEDKPIFVNSTVYNSTVNDILGRHCKACNIPIISVHGLRHTHASLLLFTGVSIASVARRLGHSSMTTTQKTYLHIIQELENKDIDLVMRSLSSLS